LDLATLADRDIVLTSWDEARATGASRAEVHLRVDPDRVAVMHYIDVRPRHGVYVAVILGADGDDALAGLADTPPMPPRIARVRKNQTAIFIEVDEATTEILGWAAGEMVGHRSLDFVHPDDQERAVQSWMQMLRPRSISPCGCGTGARMADGPGSRSPTTTCWATPSRAACWPT
jgi:PAS domain-containing protein